MKNIFYVLLSAFCIGCTDVENAIKLNDIQTTFDEFPIVDSLEFIPFSDSLLEEPSNMLISDDMLLIQTFCRAQDTYLSVFSLDENRIISEVVKRGGGPNEMLSCEMGLIDNQLWLYDMSKRRVGIAPIDSFVLSENPDIAWHELSHSYYNTAMLNDSIFLGTNNFESKLKINFVNLFSGEFFERGNYSYLDSSIDLGALIDACTCYADVNPVTKDILLSYRYTDVIEIYDSKGNIKHALQGPANFAPKFHIHSRHGMGKTPETRKAFVNTYVTGEYIYLLYSGCKRTEKNWPYGNEIFVYSWDGKPQKKYVLPQFVYAFAVDESKGIIYSYSRQTEELVKAVM